MERMKKMMENMNEEERVRMMEQCFDFMKGKETSQDKERDEKKREESACFPDMSRMAECCPEMMGTFFERTKRCFEGKSEKEKRETDKK